jgi:hypothetical protein
MEQIEKARAAAASDPDINSVFNLCANIVAAGQQRMGPDWAPAHEAMHTLVTGVYSARLIRVVQDLAAAVREANPNGPPL